MTTAVDKWPAAARLVVVAAAGHLPTAPTPPQGTRPLKSWEAKLATRYTASLPSSRPPNQMAGSSGKGSFAAVPVNGGNAPKAAKSRNAAGSNRPIANPRFGADRGHSVGCYLNNATAERTEKVAGHAATRVWPRLRGRRLSAVAAARSHRKSPEKLMCAQLSGDVWASHASGTDCSVARRWAMASAM